MIDTTKLVQDLRLLGVKEDDTIVVHSAYKAIVGGRKVENGPDAVIAALKETVPRGTLMLPTLTYESVTPENRRFDVRQTKGNTGVLAEHMRHAEGVIRSLHPTHSIAIWGKDAEAIAEAHLRDFTPVGPNSPLREAPRRNGKVVMLGCGLVPNTSIHGIEEMVVPPYLYGENYDYELLTQDGTRIRKAYLAHGDHYARSRFERIADLLTDTDYQTGKVLEADCTVIHAKAMWEAGLKALRKDKLYFVADSLDA